VTRIAIAMLVIGAAAAAALVLNLLLLDRASGNSDRIGRLQPLATIPTTAPPKGTVRPATTTGHTDTRDEHGGRGHGSDD
jgi:hypothetical protein